MTDLRQVVAVGPDALARRAVSENLSMSDTISVTATVANLRIAARKLHHEVADCVVAVDQEGTIAPDDVDIFCEHHPDMALIIAVSNPTLPKLPRPRVQVTFIVVPPSGTWLDDATQRLEMHVRRTVGTLKQDTSRPAQKAPAIKGRPGKRQAPRLVVIGSSTGGPAALDTVIGSLPQTYNTPTLICQHIPAGFTAQLAARLNARTHLEVSVLSETTQIRPGQILIAPGDKHAVATGASGSFGLDGGPPVNSVIPSVDVLFESVARFYGSSVLGVILTGMGVDGLDGVRALSECGSATIVQDEASSVVWGMPGAVARANLADEVLDLEKIASTIVLRVAATRKPRGNAADGATPAASREAEPITQ